MLTKNNAVKVSIMGKSLIIFICLFTCFKNFSQVIIIVDSLNKKPLPFVRVKYKLNKIHERLSDLNQPFTAMTVKNRFIGKDNTTKMLLVIFQDHNAV